VVVRTTGGQLAAKGTFSIQPGSTAVVPLTLSKPARKALRASGSVPKLKVRVTARDKAGNKRSIGRTLRVAGAR
jgi:hypothetical protein